MIRKGLFITFEGPDGSGKSTVSNGVYKKLIENGHDVVFTREPGGSDIAEKIREIILDVKHTNMDIKTETLLYAASRRQHLIETVLPALYEGKLIICDRFVDSSLAYQGVGREVGYEEVLKINEFAIEGVYPDMTIFLSIPFEKGLERIKNRKNKDRLDQETIEFHSKVSEGYQRVLEQFSDRIVSVSAEQSIDEVIDQAYNYVIAKVFEHENDN